MKKTKKKKRCLYGRPPNACYTYTLDDVKDLAVRVWSFSRGDEPVPGWFTQGHVRMLADTLRLYGETALKTRRVGKDGDA